MRDIFIGVDGGGTNCRLVVNDQDGDVLCQSAVRASGDIAVQPEQVWKNFLSLFKESVVQIKTTAGIDITDQSLYRLNIGFGVAGFSAIESRKKFIELVEKSALFYSYKIDNDVYAAYWDAHHGKDGGIIIIGTGIIGILYVDQKPQLRFGGMGFPHDNGGSVAWLGKRLAHQLLTLCGKLLKHVGQEVNLEAVLTQSSEPGAKLFLALLNHPHYYSMAEPANFIKIYKLITELEFYQYVFANVRTPVLYARIGGFILDVLRDEEFLNHLPFAETVKHEAEILMRAAAAKVDAIYAEVKKDGVPFALYGGASQVMSRYVGEDLQQALCLVNPKTAARGASEMIMQACRKQSATLVAQHRITDFRTMLFAGERSPAEKKLAVAAEIQITPEAMQRSSCMSLSVRR
jgi:N-acetylglucosamine kinase-like BadF-type ATPase